MPPFKGITYALLGVCVGIFGLSVSLIGLALTYQYHAYNGIVSLGALIAFLGVAISLASAAQTTSDTSVAKEKTKVMQPTQLLRKTLVSLGVSIGLGVAILLGTLYGLQIVFGNADYLLGVLPALSVGGAIFYAVSSRASDRGSFNGMFLRLARNILVALLGGFTFTTATSSSYGSVLFSLSGMDFWMYMQFLLMGPLLLWTCIAFLITTIFSLHYSGRLFATMVLRRQYY